jgi:hypothetical protein
MAAPTLPRDGDEGRYERAAVRWTGRFALEARTATLDAIQQAVAALDALPQRSHDATAILAQLCVKHGLK